jgi:predicted DNA-binding protein (MmcQ/YjbR family)
MKLEEFQQYCESFKAVRGDFPFDESTLVYKVKGKMFALTNFEKFESFSVKCDPETALVLRQIHKTVTAGYHLNKRHWNTVKIDGSIDDETLKGFIRDSYNLVVSGLSRKVKNELSEESS